MVGDGQIEIADLGPEAVELRSAYNAFRSESPSAQRPAVLIALTVDEVLMPSATAETPEY